MGKIFSWVFAARTRSEAVNIAQTPPCLFSIHVDWFGLALTSTRANAPQRGQHVRWNQRVFFYEIYSRFTNDSLRHHQFAKDVLDCFASAYPINSPITKISIHILMPNWGFEALVQSPQKKVLHFLLMKKSNFYGNENKIVTWREHRICAEALRVKLRSKVNLNPLWTRIEKLISQSHPTNTARKQVILRVIDFISLTTGLLKRSLTYINV